MTRPALLLVALSCALAATARADDAPVVGHNASSADAMILSRAKPGGDWRVLAPRDSVHAGATLLGLPGAAIDAQDDAVRLTLLTDLDGTSPFPVRENAVVLHPASGADLDFTLDRGRVVLSNRKASGPAIVRLHAWNADWTLTLDEPGAQLGLELFGRWPAGVRFTPEPKPSEVPVADLIFLALKGEALVNDGRHAFRLHAPPGPALIEWDSVTGMDPAAQRLDQLPAWADAAPHTARGRDRRESLDQLHELLAAKGLDGAITELLNSDDRRLHRLAVSTLAATDQLERLALILTQGKHADAWDAAVPALRHWLGRAPGQDQKLYRALLARGFPAGQAATVLQGLHSFGDADLARPELYELLIDYLTHDRLAIRGLAYWHLVRLVPEGKSIGYDPFAPKEAREQAARRWRELIPTGTVPQKPQPHGR